MPGVHENLGWRVIELRRVQRFHDRDLIRDGRQIWQQFRQLRAALASLMELMRRPEKFGYPFDECEALAFDQILWTWLAVEFPEGGFRSNRSN